MVATGGVTSDEEAVAEDGENATTSFGRSVSTVVATAVEVQPSPPLVW